MNRIIFINWRWTDIEDISAEKNVAKDDNSLVVFSNFQKNRNDGVEAFLKLIRKYRESFEESYFLIFTHSRENSNNIKKKDLHELIMSNKKKTNVVEFAFGKHPVYYNEKEQTGFIDTRKHDFNLNYAEISIRDEIKNNIFSSLWCKYWRKK